MRIDIVTIFPSFFDVLDLSLLGKARQSGIIEVRTHDLRDHTRDRHRQGTNARCTIEWWRPEGWQSGRLHWS